MTDQIDPLQFFSLLKWVTGKPLLGTIEFYRREIFSKVLYTFMEDGVTPQYNLFLSGRGKKGWKTSDGALATIYRFMCWRTEPGFSNDCWLVANSLEQSKDDFGLIKKLFLANPLLAQDVEIRGDRIVRTDGNGILTVVASGAGAAPSVHGKSSLFTMIDEIGGQKNWDVIEALALDPTRPDALMWLTGYAGPVDMPGIPVSDLLARAKAGADPRFALSWYAGDWSTDPAFQSPDLTPEQRANPSMGSWPEGAAYLTEAKSRLPSNVYRRIHLNLPTKRRGSAYDPEAIDACIPQGIRKRPRHPTAKHYAFCDLSAGSNDDSVLAIAHHDPVLDMPVLDYIGCQPSGVVPFNPRNCIRHFGMVMQEYGCLHVQGDQFGGETFRLDWVGCGRSFEVCATPTHELFEILEIKLNTQTCSLLDHPRLRQQMIELRVSGTTGKMGHASGVGDHHDDFVAAAAGALWLAKPNELSGASQQAIAPVLVAGETYRGTRYGEVGGVTGKFSPTIGWRWDATDWGH